MANIITAIRIVCSIASVKTPSLSVLLQRLIMEEQV